MICRKATVALPDANPYPFEHKIGIFVRFWPSEPPVFRVFEHKIGVVVLCLVSGWAMTEASTRLCGLRADVC